MRTRWEKLQALVLTLGAALIAPASAAPVLRVVRGATPGTALLRNGGFETGRGETPSEWRTFENGFRWVAGQGRNDSRAVVRENRAAGGQYGAVQTMTLNRAAIAPLVVRGWSKAENVSGSSDDGYSLYVDIVYADSTPLWGQTANFRCGTHDWERRELVILPDKPVKAVSLYCLFRGHTGRVWFDDVTLEEVKTDGDAVQFQGAPVQAVPHAARGAGEITGPLPGNFLARDVAADSDVYGFVHGACPELNLRIQSRVAAQEDYTVVSGRLSDTTGNDRAVTLICAFPLDATGWHWGDDIRHSRRIEGRGEFANTVRAPCGATGKMSLYPLAAVWDERTGVALALDMAQPAQCRLGYHAGLKQLFIAFDFGLVKDTERFPSSADFRFVVYRFKPRWGFRAAFDKLTKIFPDYFEVRSREQGIWMPFTDVSTVQGWQDFGFRYHEGDNNLAWDNAHAILSFRYTEPMTWWMPMEKGVPRTEAAALSLRDDLAKSEAGGKQRMAQVSQTAGMLNEDGRPCLLFRDEPWCNGAVWSLNPNPHLPGDFNAATVHWNDAIKQKLYGPEAKAGLDGEYLDSLEGYVTADLNYRREHFRYTTVPLTFSQDARRPALFKGLAVFEFTKWIGDDVHRLGKLTFANGVPYRFTYLCPWLDAMGTETNWLVHGKYQPPSDELMSLWRTMSGGKPYLLLMNTDYDAFTPELVEKYFQRSLFYGFLPSMFSHNAAEKPYWKNPNWYNRDRPLFKKYIPLIQRIADACWQPITEAACDNVNILVERFGPDASGAVYVTLLNDTASPQSGTLLADADRVARDLIANELLVRGGEGWQVNLQPQQATVISLAPPSQP